MKYLNKTRRCQRYCSIHMDDVSFALNSIDVDFVSFAAAYYYVYYLVA